MKKTLENILNFVKDKVKIGVIFGSLVFGGAVYGNTGKLEIINSIGNPYGSQSHATVHRIEATEGYDDIYDHEYGFMSGPTDVFSKIISKIPGYELDVDSRPLDSNTSINLELSLHSENGQPISITSGNELICNLPLEYLGYDFGSKPITLQQQDLSDLNKDGKVDFHDFAILANDYGETGNALAGDISGEYNISDGHVDFYDVAYFSGGWLNKRVYPVYDIRDANEFNNGVIPLPGLDGTYISEKPYSNFQLRFDRFLSDLNDDGKVDFRDYALFAGGWGKKDMENHIANISGSNGIPDYNNVTGNAIIDGYDLGRFCKGWLKDITDPNTW